MAHPGDRRIAFVCEHGAFRSRMAAAFFNESAPPGWTAVSAGVTPQSEVSARLGPLMAGTPAATFIDDEPPRSLNELSATRTIAIDTDVEGAETWRIGTDAPQSDPELRDEIRRRVLGLLRDLSGKPKAG